MQRSERLGSCHLRRDIEFSPNRTVAAGRHSRSATPTLLNRAAVDGKVPRRSATVLEWKGNGTDRLQGRHACCSLEWDASSGRVQGRGLDGSGSGVRSMDSWVGVENAERTIRTYAV